MTIAASPFLLRSMTAADLDQIAEIEAESFPSVWPATAYRREMQENRLARYLVVVDRRPSAEIERIPKGGFLWGLTRLFQSNTSPPPRLTERIAGFLGLWLMPDESHIVIVATRSSLRRQGVGELLLLAAFDLTEQNGIDRVTLECRVSNVEAQAMYEKWGFAREGVRKRYYTDTNEDALIMTTPSMHDTEYRVQLDQLRRRLYERRGIPSIEHPELQAPEAAP